jgi:hypothetical protein
VTGNQNGRCGRIRGDDGSHDGRADSPWLSAWDDKSRTRAGTLHAVPNVKQRGQRQVSKVCFGAQTQFSSSGAVARRFDIVFVSLTKGCGAVVAGDVERRERQNRDRHQKSQPKRPDP